MMNVDKSSMEPEALEQLCRASPAAPHSPSQHITSQTQPPSVALGAPAPTGETENSPRSVGTEPITPTLAATLPHSFPQATLSSGSPGFAQSTQQLFWLTRLKRLDAGSMPHIKQPLASSEGKPNGLSKELLWLWEEMNTALEELLKFRASMDCCCTKLDLGLDLAAHPNDAQLTEAKVCNTATAATLQ